MSQHTPSPPLDQYGNTGNDITNCCFPDCGCDGARLCMARNGASYSAMTLNRERGSQATQPTGEQAP